MLLRDLGWVALCKRILKPPLTLRLRHYVMYRIPRYTDYNKFHLAMYYRAAAFDVTGRKNYMISDLRNTSSLELT